MRVQPLRSVAEMLKNGGVILNEVKVVLKNGGVVLHATETCYGLAADIFNQAAVEKTYALKKMDKGKPVSIMVRGLAEARKYARCNKTALELAKKHWPGPLTIILPRKKSLPEFLNPGHKTVGIRCPDHEVTQLLIAANGRPLVTTSANISGKPQAYRVEDYLQQLKERGVKARTRKARAGKTQAGTAQQPDLVIDSGKIPPNKPSTVVEVQVKGTINVIRSGAIVV